MDKDVRKQHDAPAIKPYKKDATYSYTLGAFPTIELLKCKPEKVMKVLVHSTFTEKETIETLCRKNGIPLEYNDKQISRLSDKENCFVIGIFEKYTDTLNPKKSHLVLVNPSNMGNLGTIIRTAVGFGIYDIAIITPCADVFNPKTVRGSMGSLFHLNLQMFSSYEEYERLYADHEAFCFILNKEKTKTLAECEQPELFSLVFGNEATGLPEKFLNVGTSVMIPQSPDVDSLNLTIAVGIGLYHFTNGNR